MEITHSCSVCGAEFAYAGRLVGHAEAVHRIRTARAIKAEHDLPAADGRCTTGPCDGQPGPSHRGSARCQSGSLASGGHRSHCSCDTCY